VERWNLSEILCCVLYCVADMWCELQRTVDDGSTYGWT